MPTPDKIRTSIAEYIQKALDEDNLNEHKVEVIRLFLEHYGAPAERKRRIDRTEEEDEKDPADRPEPFPTEGLVTGARAADFLGFGDYKNPAGMVRRLASDGEIPPPVRGRGNAFLWYAQDMREYARKIGEKNKSGRAA
jgi:hypothetical protein